MKGRRFKGDVVGQRELVGDHNGAQRRRERTGVGHRRRRGPRKAEEIEPQCTEAGHDLMDPPPALKSRRVSATWSKATWFVRVRQAGTTTVRQPDAALTVGTPAVISVALTDVVLEGLVHVRDRKAVLKEDLTFRRGHCGSASWPK